MLLYPLQGYDWLATLVRVYYQYGPTGKHKTIIVDMDGTLVDTSSLHDLLREIRNPDGTWDPVGLDLFNQRTRECPANWEIIDICSGYWSQGIDVVVMTAREEKYRSLTKGWLNKYGVPYKELYMRALGDLRPDREVKKDLLAEVRKHWDVVFAIDDQPAIIELWKEEGIDTRTVPGWVAL